MRGKRCYKSIVDKVVLPIIGNISKVEAALSTCHVWSGYIITDNSNLLYHLFVMLFRSCSINVRDFRS